jgi:hypothetical protein
MFSFFFKVIHAISSLTYWQSYVKDDMSMDGLDCINCIIMSLTRIDKIYPKCSVLIKVIMQYPQSHIGTHMWKTICPWMAWIE